ncbi:hypothetical protein C8J57DRAFT_190757 [Mycena rebaudengoi]|nr:hypothetical protein C8J57DRAFT_190757 [Mycena rebaudengoi]
MRVPPARSPPKCLAPSCLRSRRSRPCAGPVTPRPHRVRGSHQGRGERSSSMTPSSSYHRLTTLCSKSCHNPVAVPHTSRSPLSLWRGSRRAGFTPPRAHPSSSWRWPLIRTQTLAPTFRRIHVACVVRWVLSSARSRCGYWRASPALSPPHRPSFFFAVHRIPSDRARFVAPIQTHPFHQSRLRRRCGSILYYLCARACSVRTYVCATRCHCLFYRPSSHPRTKGTIKTEDARCLVPDGLG